MLEIGENSDGHIYLRIGLLPALVQPERLVTECFTLGIEAPLAHVHRDVVHRARERIVQLLQMHVPIVVHHLGLVEETVHVAFELFVLVDLLVAELLDRFCKGMNQSLISQSEVRPCWRTFSKR